MDENDYLKDNRYILYSQKDTENIFKGMKGLFRMDNVDNKRLSNSFHIKFHSQFYRCDSLTTNPDEIFDKTNDTIKQKIKENMELEDIHPYKIKKFDLLNKKNPSKSYEAAFQDAKVEIRPLVNKDDTINMTEINKLISLFHDITGQGIEKKWGMTAFFNTPHQDFDEQHKYKTEWCSDAPMFFLDQEDSDLFDTGHGLPLVFKEEVPEKNQHSKVSLKDYIRPVKCQILFIYNIKNDLDEELEKHDNLNSTLADDTELVILTSSGLEKLYEVSENDNVEKKIHANINPLEITISDGPKKFKIYEYMFLARKDLYFVVKKFSNLGKRGRNYSPDTTKNEIRPQKKRTFIAGSKSKKYKHKSNKTKKRKVSKKKKHTNRKRKINYKSKKRGVLKRENT